MSKTTAGTAISRRHFLKELVASSGFVLLAPGTGPRRPGYFPLAWLVKRSLRIGLLLPRFRTYPQVSASFVDGMTLFLSQSDALHDLRLLTAETESRVGLSRAGAARLLQEGQADVLVSLANPALTQHLRPLLSQAGIPLLVSHAGANRIDVTEPRVTYNTLGYWQASYRAGAWAVQTLGRRAVAVSSFYESGYDALYAFEQGVDDHGASVVRTYITHVPGRPLPMSELLSRIAAQAPDFVYTHASGSQAADFITAYTASARTRSIPLVGSSFLMDEALPAPPTAAVRDLYSVASWSPRLQTPENERFMAAFQARYGRSPDSFAVLGYDTGGLLAAALSEAGGTGAALADALRQARFDGPRGALQVDAAAQTTAAPLYLRQLTWQAGAYRQEVRAGLPPVSEQVARLSGPRTGWLDPYLSI